MKPPVSNEGRQQVLTLRRRYSLREVAERTGLPLGTVKTICSRSGAFRDNPAHRALFSLPPMQASSQTLPAVQEIPPQQALTGDNEIDAVLWLREVIGTGQAALIAKAMEAAKRVTTPMDELEKRYTKHLVSTNPGNLFAALSSFGFGDLESLAVRSIEKLTLKNEGSARFGETLFDSTDAESFCISTLDGMKPSGTFGNFDEREVAARFKARPEVMPNTLNDCLHELTYWHELYRLRNATGGFGDPPQEAYARECFVFGSLAEIRPRSKEESVDVFRYMAKGEYMDRSETNDILLNLIG